MAEEIKDVTNESKNKLEINVIPNSQYLKKKEFESFKNVYELSKLEQKEKPRTDIDLNLRINDQDITKGIYEVVINVSTKTILEELDLFRINIDYGGIFTIISKDGAIDDATKEQILMIHCPTILFPYIRKEISTESVEGGFPPLILNNIDFGSLYMQKKEEDKQMNSQVS